ncbi:Zn-dependent protease with chaperone function [Humibacillus xanthopallidus]|uniref:Zn-dependent protease with chaperone function n=1 Tax=Humibacillus xanthopallidus TaxID=412689 RepID=A0A543PLL4_9MICO|nr:M56 family metallopeptidase [Humibacillus xanthopallidus]TQN44965.1 Zn-dependent protease with chaperone function [Humibacillus xanthopallidus]
MLVLALVALALLLAWPVPRALARVTTVRRGPRAALVLWQSTAVAAVLAALFAAPAAVPWLIGSAPRLRDSWPVLAVAALLTGIVTVRLLVSGDRVGRNLRSVRRRHRELVDLLATQGDGHTRVLEHTTPTAYCLPGVRRRVVLTQGTIDRLSPDELDAVMAHERAHLAARHDLVMEFFTVVHEAVPGFVRSSTALREVHLLIEVLADRAAVRRAGVVTTARAIVGMADGPKPAGAMAIRESTAAAKARIELLEGGRVAGLPAPVASTLMYAASIVLVAAPLTLLVLAFAGFSPA